jgi:hypothetical protein
VGPTQERERRGEKKEVAAVATWNQGRARGSLMKVGPLVGLRVRVSFFYFFSNFKI